MGAVESFLDRRIDVSTLPLAIGDVSVILLVVALGMVRHYGVNGLTANPADVVLTALPFLVGWVVAAPLIGAYSAGAGESAKAAVPLAIRSWVVADVIGIALRATPLFDGGENLADLLVFFVVMLLVGAIGLALWRGALFKVR